MIPNWSTSTPTVKQRLYARCGIPEYWILALPEGRLDVYRDPAGESYQSVTNHAAGGKVAPLARRGFLTMSFVAGGRATRPA